MPYAKSGGLDEGSEARLAPRYWEQQQRQQQTQSGPRLYIPEPGTPLPPPVARPQGAQGAPQAALPPLVNSYEQYPSAATARPQDVPRNPIRVPPQESERVARERARVYSMLSDAPPAAQAQPERALTGFWGDAPAAAQGGTRTFDPNDPAILEASRRFEQAYAENPQQFAAPSGYQPNPPPLPEGAYESYDPLAGWSPWEPEVRVAPVQPYQWQAPAMPGYADIQRFRPQWIDSNWAGGW